MKKILYIFTILFFVLVTNVYCAGLSGDKYTLKIDNIDYKVVFYDTYLQIEISPDNKIILNYQYWGTFGNLEGVPFYIYGDYLVLVTQSIVMTKIIEKQPEFQLSYVMSIPYYLWHGAARSNGDIFWGSYITQSNDDPSNPDKTNKTATFQKYYKISPPYTTYNSYSLKNTGNHESSRPFFLNNTQFIITERGYVFVNGDNNNSYIVGSHLHYLLSATSYNGLTLFAHSKWTGGTTDNPVEGTKLYYWDGSKNQSWNNYSNPNIMTFKMLEYNGELWLFGTTPTNSSGTQSGRIYKVNSFGVSTQVSIQNETPGFFDAIVFNNELYAGCGTRSGGIAAIYKLVNNQFILQKTFSSNINNFGTFIEYNGYLFASGLKSGGSAEILILNNGQWSLLFNEDDFKSLKSKAGVSSSLLQPSGFFVKTDKIYLMLNDTSSSRSGPSYMFSIEEKK